MDTSWSEKLRSVLLRYAEIAQRADELGPHTDLLRDFGLDSIAVVNLLADLETEFAIVIDASDITLPVLSRLESLEAYIRSKASLS